MMKRKVVFLLVFGLMLSLSGCDGEEEQSQFGSELLEKMKEETASEDVRTDGSNWEKVDEKESQRTYKTVEEVLALFESGDLSEFIDYAEEEDEEVVIETGNSGEDVSEVTYQGGKNTVTFDESVELSDQAVEFWDWRSEMSEEELAEYDAFDPNDPQWQQYEDELLQEMDEMEQYEDMEILPEDYEQQLQEALEELEGLEIPEEYLQYLPEGFDLDSLLESYQ